MRQPLGWTVWALVLPWAVLCLSAWAGTVEDARKLKAEADQTLRGASGGAADPKVYAAAVLKLEQAMAILEEAAKQPGSRVEGLQEEIVAALFWARRFANLDVIREIGKGHSPPAPGPGQGPPPGAKDGGGAGDAAKDPPSPLPGKGGPAGGEGPRERSGGPGTDETGAEQAFKKGLEFEERHKGEDHAVALRWFQIAEQFNGTEWSLKALDRAREAQRRYQEALTEAELAKTEDGKLIAEGNRLLREEKFKEALLKFQEAHKLKPSTLSSRRIAHTFLRVGYNLRDEFAAKYLPLAKRYEEARREGNRALMASLAQQRKALSSMEADILHCYKKARASFEDGLRMAEGGDLDCEAHLGILEYQEKKRPLARLALTRVIERYKPKNDEERTVHEYSKTLLGDLGGPLH